MTYKDIIKLFESFAIAHPDVAKFKSDTLDRLDNFSNEDEIFPMLYISQISNIPRIYPSEYKSTLYSFRAFVLVPRIDLDIISLDNDVDLNQTTNNLDQCQQIINNFKGYIYDNFEDFSFSSVPINEFGIDRLQGLSLDFDIEVQTDECSNDWK